MKIKNGSSALPGQAYKIAAGLEGGWGSGGSRIWRCAGWHWNRQRPLFSTRWAPCRPWGGRGVRIRRWHARPGPRGGGGRGYGGAVGGVGATGVPYGQVGGLAVSPGVNVGYAGTPGGAGARAAPDGQPGGPTLGPAGEFGQPGGFALGSARRVRSGATCALAVHDGRTGRTVGRPGSPARRDGSASGPSTSLGQASEQHYHRPRSGVMEQPLRRCCGKVMYLRGASGLHAEGSRTRVPRRGHG